MLLIFFAVAGQIYTLRVGEGNDMDMLVGGIALLVGLVAVGLALMTIQKANRQNEKLVKVQIGGVKDGPGKGY